MFESVISKFIPDKSIINHNYCHDGLFFKRERDTIRVRFDKGDCLLKKTIIRKVGGSRISAAIRLKGRRSQVPRSNSRMSFLPGR